MGWARASLVMMCGLALACGPDGVASPETEGETDESSSGTTGSSNSASATNTATATTPTTNSSNSGSATTTNPTATVTTDPPPDTSATDDPSETTPPTTTDECPFGTEGCLCDVGAECDEGLFCNDEGICEAPPDCRPLDTDPHGDEDSAYELEGLMCGDGNDLGVVGTIEGPQIDWYTFFGNDFFGCPEQPAAAIMADIDLEVCVYIECVEGTTSGVTCGEGSDATSPSDRPGCCGPNTAQIGNYDCTGMFASKDVDVYISVGSDEMICQDYALSYAF